MRKARVVFLVALVVSLLAFHVPWISASPDNGNIDRLIATYGKDKIISLILNRRSSNITLFVNGVLSDSFGPPDSNYITPRSILEDLKKMKISSKQFEELLADQKRKEDDLEKERIRQIEEMKIAEIKHQEWLLTDEGKKYQEQQKEERRVAAEKERVKQEIKEERDRRVWANYLAYQSMKRQIDSECQLDCSVNRYQYDTSCHRACMSVHGF